MTDLTKVFEVEIPNAFGILKIGVVNDIPDYFSFIILSKNTDKTEGTSISICDGGSTGDSYEFVCNGTIDSKTTQIITTNMSNANYYRGYTDKAENKQIDVFPVRAPSQSNGHIKIHWDIPNADLKTSKITSMNHFYDTNYVATSNRLFLTESAHPYGRFIVCDTKNNTQLSVSDMVADVDFPNSTDSLAVWKGMVAFKVNQQRPGIFSYNYNTNTVDSFKVEHFKINDEEFTPVDLCIDQKFNTLIIFMSNEHNNAVLRAAINTDGTLEFLNKSAVIYKKEYSGTYITCYSQTEKILYAIPHSTNSLAGKIEIIKPFEKPETALVEYSTLSENASTIALDEKNNILYCGHADNSTVSVYKTQ